MDFSHYSDTTVKMAVELVNTRSPFDETDRLTTVEDLVGFLANYAEEWDPGDFVPATPTSTDLEEVRELRLQLRSVFHAADDEEAADRINRLLVGVGAVPRVSTHGDGPHLHFEPDGRHVRDWLGAATAMAVATLLVEEGIERLGVCAASDCQDVFVDTSRNRSRKQCSNTCTTRENVARFRSRQRDD